MSVTRKVLIIGAGSGIARSICRELASRHAHLGLLARSHEKLITLSSDLQRQGASSVAIEAFDFNHVDEHLVRLQSIDRKLSGFDTAIVCYGVLGDEALSQRDFSVAEPELRTNFISQISFLTHLGNMLESRGEGSIAAFSSVAGDRGRSKNYVYGAAKAGLTTFLEGQRSRLSAKGVHVVTVKPGFVDTPMTSHLRKNILFSQPDRVARDVIRGIERRASVVYTPWYWRFVMLAYKCIPSVVSSKLKL